LLAAGLTASKPSSWRRRRNRSKLCQEPEFTKEQRTLLH